MFYLILFCYTSNNSVGLRFGTFSLFSFLSLNFLFLVSFYFFIFLNLFLKNKFPLVDNPQLKLHTFLCLSV